MLWLPFLAALASAHRPLPEAAHGANITPVRRLVCVVHRLRRVRRRMCGVRCGHGVKCALFVCSCVRVSYHGENNTFYLDGTWGQ